MYPNKLFQRGENGFRRFRVRQGIVKGDCILTAHNYTNHYDGQVNAPSTFDNIYNDAPTRTTPFPETTYHCHNQ
jgi:hypothetical protein